MPRGRVVEDEDQDSSFNPISPPIFKGDNYNLWAIRMKTYMEALDLWDAVEEDYPIPNLPNNPTNS